MDPQGIKRKSYRYYTSNSCLRISSFLASDLELLCTSKITATPATYTFRPRALKETKYYVKMNNKIPICQGRKATILYVNARQSV